MIQSTFDPALIVNGIVTLGAVIGGIKISMNGIHRSLERLEKGQEKQTKVLDSHSTRLTEVETTIKFLHKEG